MVPLRLVLAVLAIVGLLALVLLAVNLALSGHTLAFLWLAACLMAAGWAYHDAEHLSATGPVLGTRTFLASRPLRAGYLSLIKAVTVSMRTIGVFTSGGDARE